MKRPTSFILNNLYIKSSLRASMMRAILFLCVAISSIDEVQALSFTGASNSIISNISANYENVSGKLETLNNPDQNSKYYSGSVSAPAYLEIEIKNGGLIQSEDGNLVVYTRRINTNKWPENINDNPTAFRVEGQFDGSTDWKHLFNVYFLYRGSYTDEFSSRIPISDIWNKSGATGSKLTKLRLYIIATNGAIASETKNVAMAMNRFDILKVSSTEPYSEPWSDRFHLTTDYRTHLKDTEFRHTQGIFDDVNRVAGWDRITGVEKTELESHGIVIPDFEPISNNSKNKPICTLAPGQALQPTHEVEHILYAMPGDVINLYPYYEFYGTYQFYENFSHWYDYKTGGRLKYPDPATNQWAKDFDMLDFLTDPEKIQISDKEGFFAGFGMAGINDFSKTTYTVKNENDYINAVKAINEHQKFSYIILDPDSKVLDFSGYSNVPMLGDGYAFQGIINGNGTTIKSLKYDKRETIGVGLVGTGGGVVVIKNLILDETCIFQGKRGVGLVGYLASGSLSVSNIKTEATVCGYNKITYPDGATFPYNQNAGGILGACNYTCTFFKIEDCFIGGTIGEDNIANADINNAAIIADWDAKTINGFLKNIVVNCNLIGAETKRYVTNEGNVPTFSHYVRYSKSHVDATDGENEWIKLRGGITFDHCYGDLQSTDECWKPFRTPASLPANPGLTGWNTTDMIPPMNGSTTYTGKTHKVGTPDAYIEAVNTINAGAYSDNIELTGNIDFKDYNVPMIGKYSSPGFYTGHFNGCGYTISNLKIDKPSGNRVGIFEAVGDGAVIENLIIDNTCEIIGNYWVGFIGSLYRGGVTIRNIKTEATITAYKVDTEASAAGIIGIAAYKEVDKKIEMSDVYIGGIINGVSNSRAIVGYLDAAQTTSESNFKNVVIDCDIKNPAPSGSRYVLYGYRPELAKFINCYGNGIDDADTRVTPYVMTKKQYIDDWKDAETPAMSGKIHRGYELAEGDSNHRLEDHKPGSVATFFCPKNPFDDELYQSLPLQTGDNEYIIAADFSKTFDLNTHLDFEHNILSEPILAFRHIFRIRDGKAFADKNFGSYTGNREYVRRNQKFVSARCGVPFQIRLTTPVPETPGPSVPTNIYYKKSAKEYGRVSGKMEIILLDGDTREVIDKSNPRYTEFSFGDAFEGVGQREIDNVNYNIGDGTNNFYRMLKCTPPENEERHYIVQLVASEDPNNANKRINVYLDPAKDPDNVADPYLIVAEYNIRFLPKKGATMLTMDALYDKDEYSFARVETLEKKFGTPIDVINFDEYIDINTLENRTLMDKLISLNETKDIYGNDIAPNKNTKYKLKNPDLYHTFFKWPIPWDRANYAYGFNYRDGYNMYMLTTHSDQVYYKQAVFLRDYYTYDGPGNTSDDLTDQATLNSKDPKPIKGNENADNHGRGLYDVKYYRSKRNIDEYYKSQQNTVNEPVTRANDGTDSNAPKLEQGYFYWGNAASDPGVATRLKINSLCPGSTIHVSAWLAEFSIDEESTNLSFNFVAVMKKDNAAMGVKAGDRVVLHSFITGYVPDGGKFYRLKNGQPHWVYNTVDKYYDLNMETTAYRNYGETTTTGKDDDMRGQWLNVYYSFVPRIAEFGFDGLTDDDIYYELELDNNAKSSKGADFGIDDIRMYLEPPTVEAKQVSPACDNEEIRMQLASPFETLLEIARKTEKTGNESEDLIVYYTYLDKAEYDRKYDESNGNSKEAFDASIIKFNYNISPKDESRKYGKITFNGNFSKNPEYRGKDASGNIITPVFGKAYAETKETGERMIVFESEISKGNLTAGKEYYVVFKSVLDASDAPEEGEESEFFNKEEACANTGKVFIVPSNITKINGYVPEDLANITVCENQIPVIQVNIWGTNEKGESKELGKNVYFDWFYGTINDFNGYNDGNTQHTLKAALEVFRTRYPKAENLDGIKADKVKPEGKEMFEQWMLDIIRKAISPEEYNGLSKLTLFSTSYLMPSIDLDGKTQKRHSVVVIPISAIIKEDLSAGSDKDYLVCTTPTELGINFGNNAPSLKHGLTDITYPVDLNDVPLRIGLNQIRKETRKSYNEYERTMKTITIPVRHASSTDGKVKSLKLVKEYKGNGENLVEKEGCVLLVRTNDPIYKDLGTVKDGVETGQLQWVGQIKELEASTSPDKASENYFKVEFYPEFDFKEGYFYSFRFQFDEEGSENNENVCNGQDVFTLKIVPKYQLWTGTENINWNNDANWSRVDADELKMTDLSLPGPYLTNGARGAEYLNTTKNSYAPLDFTYVVVKDNGEAPYLVAYDAVDKKDLYENKYPWTGNPSVKAEGKNYADEPESVGSATTYIQYDMAAFYLEKDEGKDESVKLEVGCRPWYANTCREIHFKPGGTIMNQQELNYKKAWVDMELNHSRWYTVSSPLQNVFAGDFYLPSNGARQETELYQDITFDNTRALNDRFKPAVFQRGWDKSVAKVYELNASKEEVSTPRNVAVKTFWSHVYNDVEEEYGGGVGFSIKTDISAMTSNKPGDNGKVLFRLPKADTEYKYWNKDGSMYGHATTISRGEGHHRLNDSQGTLTATSAEKGEYFLIGNPFMTHMDIQKFLATNSGKLEQKYWVITESGQIAGSVGENNVMSAVPTGTEDPTVIAPMQGFFVQAKEPVESLCLNYDESMMRRYDRSGAPLTTTTRSEENGSTLKITSYNYGNPYSAALLVTNGMSRPASDVIAMDNRDLDILSTVYTAKEGTALSINFCEDAESTEIGVIADDDTETVLRFEGVEAVDGLYLLDKTDRSLTPLEEGMELTVSGAAAGRFFLTYGIADEGLMSGIEWRVDGGVLTAVDNAASGSLEVDVYDTVGRLVKQDATDADVLEMALEHGIYVVVIRTAKEYESIKVRI